MSTEAAPATTESFSKLRKILFPIHKFELKKALPMALIFFFVLFNYTCIRNIKDALVVTYSGAEALSFLKLLCVTPVAILFMIFYIKASNILSNEKLFYCTLSPFIIFFGLFGFVLYPMKDFLHFSPETVHAWQIAYPQLKWPITIIGGWTYSLFYILAELWGSAILSLSFWQFANQICKTSEAKRFYAFFAFIGQLSMFATGYFGIHFSDMRGKVEEGVDPWGVSLYWLMGGVVIGGIAIMVIYRWIYRKILTDKRFYDKPYLPGVVQNDASSKKKKKTSLAESFKVILTSPYIGLIALLIICYGISVNFIEGVWKSQLKLAFTNPNDYNVFMNKVTIYTGASTMIMLIVGSNILRLFRWFTAAIVTPTIMCLGGILFFAFILFSGQLGVILNKFGTNPLAVAVLMGATMVVIIKGTKYALFDLTKEMAYIPLDEKLKVQGKAAADVVGGRFGKAGGAGFQVLLFSIIFPGSSYTDITGIVAVSFLLICAVWLVAVGGLSKRVEAARIAHKDQA